MHRTGMKLEADLLTREWSEAPSENAHPRINTDGAPRGTSETEYPEQLHSGGAATTRSARINTDSAPRGVSHSEVGRMAFDGGRVDSDGDYDGD